MTSEYYYYGLAAMLYLATCWMFAAVRWFHTCNEPKERRPYIWPDRKMQVLCFMCSIVLVPYVVDPTNQAAWMLMKSYFPATYYFYCGLLLLCYAGTIKQWSRWKPVSWVAAIIVIATMLLPVLNAWLPFGVMSAEGVRFWHYAIIVESLLMLAYCSMAMWQVWYWIRESRDGGDGRRDEDARRQHEGHLRHALVRLHSRDGRHVPRHQADEHLGRRIRRDGGREPGA